jgi:hypothetical protein
MIATTGVVVLARSSQATINEDLLHRPWYAKVKIVNIHKNTHTLSLTQSNCAKSESESNCVCKATHSEKTKKTKKS